MPRTVLEQFELDLADAAADLEDGRAFYAVLFEERDHLPRGLVDTTLAVSPRDTAGEARAEELVAAAGVAAVHYARSVLPRRPLGPSNGSSNGGAIKGHINRR